MVPLSRERFAAPNGEPKPRQKLTSAPPGGPRLRLVCKQIPRTSSNKHSCPETRAGDKLTSMKMSQNLLSFRV